MIDKIEYYNLIQFKDIPFCYLHMEEQQPQGNIQPHFL